jgi:hypothetical protein
MADSSAWQAAPRADIFDQDEEMAALIRLFSKRTDEDQDGSHSEVMQDLELNHQNTSVEMQAGTNALPPPSRYVRRMKSAHAVPVGPSFVEVETEPTASNRKASSTHLSHRCPVRRCT